jgi:hypothetical protein
MFWTLDDWLVKMVLNLWKIFRKEANVELTQIASGAVKKKKAKSLDGRKASASIVHCHCGTGKVGRMLPDLLMLNKLAGRATTSPADCGWTVS